MEDAQTFSVMEGNIDGYPAVAMIQERLQNFPSKGDTPWFLGFSTPLSNPTPQGLPTAKEEDDLNRWEELLEGEIRAKCKMIFIGRVTWRGNRELLYYIDDPQQIAPQIQKLIDGRTLRPFASRYEHDPTWTYVRVYMK